MKKLLSVLSSLVLAAGLTSCDSGLIDMFEKLRYSSFLRNETQNTVTISFSLYQSDYSFEVLPGETLEINDTDRWHLTQNPEDVGVVDFVFSDGSCTSHGCVRVDGSGPDYIFTPQTNNIMDDGSWSTSQIKGRHYRREYIIR